MSTLGSLTPDENVLDRLQAQRLARSASGDFSKMIRVARVEVHPSPGVVESELLGHCGFVANSWTFETEIARRWGGGLYRVFGRASDGKFVAAEVRIPGRSTAFLRRL